MYRKRRPKEVDGRKSILPFFLFFYFLLVTYVGERPWWPIQCPNKGKKKEAKNRKAKRRERSSLLMLDLKDGKL